MFPVAFRGDCSTMGQEAQPISWKTLPLSMAITGMGLPRLRRSLGGRCCGRWGEGSSWHSRELGQQAAGSACSLLVFYYSGVSCCLLGTISIFGRASYCRYLVSFSSAWHSWRFWLAFLLGVRVLCMMCQISAMERTILLER